MCQITVFLWMEIKNKQVLGLQLPTDPRWVDLTQISLQEILTDHAYCEQKAASNCISLIQLYSGRTRLVEELAPIVTEEWGHFRMVLAELKKRGLTLGAQRKDEYVNGLMTFMKSNNNMEERMRERLLMFALIEARSCERFRLLSEQLEDPGLKEFYHKLMVAEAGHYHLFLELAREYYDKDAVWTRWKEWLEFEKQLLPTLELRGDRMH